MLLCIMLPLNVYYATINVYAVMFPLNVYYATINVYAVMLLFINNYLY